MRRLSRIFGTSAQKGESTSTTFGGQQAAPPSASLLQSRFPHLKITLLDLHPVKPWILFSEKKNNFIYLYDYEQNDILHFFSLHSLFEQRKEEMQLIKTLEKNYDNISLPDWYVLEQQQGGTGTGEDNSQTQQSTTGATENVKQAGDLKSIRLYDEDVVQWKLNFEKEREDSESIVKRNSTSVKTLQSVNKRLSFAASSQNLFEQAQLAASGSKKREKPFAASKTPRCIVLHLDHRVIMLRYDEVSSSLFVFDEVKHTQLDNKNITSIEFLYTHPIIAIGCSDGMIRFWNYSEKQVLKSKIIQAHGKGVSVTKMTSIVRDDPLNSYPSIITSGSDGSMNCWNIEKNIAEFSIPKAHDGYNIIDFHYDSENGTITSIGADKTVVLRNSSSGAQIQKMKLSSNALKTTIGSSSNIRTFCHVTSCNCIPSWFFIGTANSSKIFRISADLQKESWDESLDVATLTKINVKKPKYYIIKQHPLLPNTIFCGSNFGFVQLKLDYNRTPSVALSYVTSAAFPSVPGAPTTPQQLVVRRSIYYVKDKVLYMRMVNPQSESFGNPVKIMELRSLTNVSVGVSPSSKFLSVYYESEREFQIYRIDTMKVVSQGTNITQFIWSPTRDRYAYVKQFEVKKKVVGIFDLFNYTVTSVVDEVSLSYISGSTNVANIFTGKWIGVNFDDLPEERSFMFITWDGKPVMTSASALLPRARFSTWDGLTSKCLIAYADSFAVFSYAASSNGNYQFKMEGYFKEEVENAFWWNGTLFVVTKTDIKCIFVNGATNIHQVLLASFDIGPYISLFANGNEEDSLDPIPQPRPKGTISLVDVIGDNLYCMDSSSILHSISLDYSSLKFRMLVMSGRITQALSWIPYIPLELHDYLVDFLCEKGYSVEACKSFTQINPAKRFDLCLKHNLTQEAFDTLNGIQTSNFSVIRELKKEDLAKLYVRLAAYCVRNKDTTLADKCYRKSVELDELQCLRELIAFIAKFGTQQDLQDMYQSLITKQQAQQEIGFTPASPLTVVHDYNQELALISLFLQQKKKSAKHLKQAENITTSVMMRQQHSRTYEEDEDEEEEEQIVERHKHTLGTKYKGMLPLEQLIPN